VSHGQVTGKRARRLVQRRVKARVLATIAACLLASCAVPAASPHGGPPVFTGRYVYLSTLDVEGTPPTPPATITCLVQPKRLMCRSAESALSTVMTLDDVSRRACSAWTDHSDGAVHQSTSSYDDPGGLSPDAVAALQRRLNRPATRTGRVRKIAGRSCEEWRAESSLGSETYCIDISTAPDVVGPLADNGRGLPRGLVLAEDDASADGKARLSHLTTRVEPRDVGDDEMTGCPTR
jgi:hypothetical protein